jgi:hypothetical protein
MTRIHLTPRREDAEAQSGGVDIEVVEWGVMNSLFWGVDFGCSFRGWE